MQRVPVAHRIGQQRVEHRLVALAKPAAQPIQLVGHDIERVSLGGVRASYAHQPLAPGDRAWLHGRDGNEDTRAVRSNGPSRETMLGRHQRGHEVDPGQFAMWSVDRDRAVLGWLTVCWRGGVRIGHHGRLKHHR